jgi:hypothetical protein
LTNLNETVAEKVALVKAVANLLGEKEAFARSVRRCGPAIEAVVKGVRWPFVMEQPGDRSGLAETKAGILADCKEYLGDVGDNYGRLLECRDQRTMESWARMINETDICKPRATRPTAGSC